MQTHYNVMFLCTGNSARSILAEAILNHKGAPTFTAYSAGSHPAGVVRPEAIRQLESAGIRTEGLRRVSQVMVDKATTVPRGKIGARMGRVDAATMQAISKAVIGFLGP